MRDVGNGQQKVLQGFVELRDALVVALDFLGYFFHPRKNRARVLAGLLQRHDFVAGPVALRFQPLGLRDQLPPLRVDGAKLVEIDRDAPVARHLFDYVQMIPYISQIKHRLSRIPEAAQREKDESGSLATRRIRRAAGLAGTCRIGCIAADHGWQPMLKPSKLGLPERRG